MTLNSASVVLPFLNPHKNPINTGLWRKWTFFSGQIIDLHLEECIKSLIIIAFISLIIDCGTPLNAIN